MDLLFNLTEEDIKLVYLTNHILMYEGRAQLGEIEILNNWQMQKLWIEISQISRGARQMNDAPMLNNYFARSLDAGAEIPKLVFLSGHSTNMTFLRDLIGLYTIKTPELGATIWVKFFVCDECAEDDPQKYRTVTEFCNNPPDVIDSCTTANWSAITQSEDGSTTNIEFERQL